MNQYKFQSPTQTLWRSLKTLCITRVLIAGILLILLGLNNSKYIWSIDPDIYRYICFLYVIGALGFVVLQTNLQRYFLWQLSTQILFDVVMISVLFFLGGGFNNSLVILYLFPLASCAILVPLSWALFLTSLVVLYILLVGSVHLFEFGTEAALSNFGLYGATFLAVVYAVNRLANRLIRQEELALQHEKNLRIQQEINKLVVADMGDGVIVIDSASRVYACNPASKKMLGITMIPEVTQLSQMPGMQPIAEAFFSWRNHASDIESKLVKEWADTVAIAAIALHIESSGSNSGSNAGSNSVMIKGVRRDAVIHLKLRFVSVNDEAGGSDERYVIFLQDASEIENQAQQLKLASMGRLTASLAHEVRNPLSSISYAAALLGELEQGSNRNSEQATRLVKIVGDNVVRLDRLIEDILRLSRKAQIHAEPFLIKPALQEIVQEFLETHAIASEVIHLSAPDMLMIRFDLLHLREVVVNLLTNAVRYASGSPSSIQLRVMAELEDQLELHVHDDGPGITAEVRAHLFEPFYTTSRHGTGLGLYMARELCLNNGAMLDYEYRVVDMNPKMPTKANGRFVITFVKPR